MITDCAHLRGIVRISEHYSLVQGSSSAVTLSAICVLVEAVFPERDMGT